MRVDRQRGVISGVKLLGTFSKKGREYPPAVIAKAAPMYEGMRVNIDHVDPGQRRSLRDRIGLVKNVLIKEDGLYADFHYNPEHALAEQIAWDAENAPQNLGFSHDTRGTTRIAKGKTIVESIDKVLSVDLVANPATTEGLFEDTLQEAFSPEARAARAADQKAAAAEAAAEKGGSKEHMDAAHARLVAAAAHEKEADRIDKDNNATAGQRAAAEAHRVQARAHRAKAEAHHQAAAECAADEREGAQESTEGPLTMTEKEELTALREEKRNRELQESIDKELRAAGIDPANKAQCSDVFLEDLCATADADRRKAKIADRKSLLAVSSPVRPVSSAPLLEDSHSTPPATAPLSERVRHWSL